MRRNWISIILKSSGIHLARQATKSILCIVILGSCLQVSCSDEPPEREKFFLRINDYYMTEGAFNSLFKFELQADRGFDISGDTKTEFLKDLIRKKLLILEAKRMNLDQEENFRQTIERYWESTLIRDLLNQKGMQLRKETVVTPEDVKAYYDKNREFFDDTSFEELAPSIEKQIEDDRVHPMLEKWIESLVASAEVEINDETLKEKITRKGD